VYLRFVETDAEAAPPMRALGWNATEILVEDPVALEARMAGSPFRVIGPPAPLEFNPKVVAMQALGPAGELLYFTRMPPGASKFGLGSATTFVDRVFIVVLGVHDIRRTLDFYGSKFGLPVNEPVPSRVDVLADAWALPRSQPFLLGIVRLPERFLIEVDEYPPAASGKRVADGELPAGMAMVSFTVPSLEPYLAQFESPPVTLNGVPYDRRRAGVLRGPNGERIELVEARAVEAGPASGGRR
jgi:catechol 2,3-dioxygenase-like lactoylglutathione lyase family enzyme